MIVELQAALYSRLATDGTLLGMLSGGSASIHFQQAPKNSSYPYLVYSLQSGIDENETANRTKNDVVYVRAYSGVSAVQAGSIDARIDTLLHMAPLTVSGWTNIWMARERDVSTVEVIPTEQSIFMQGGFYRCRLDKE